MAVTTVTTKMVAGVKYTVQTDSSADWGSVSNSTYFYDKATEIVYYKDSNGVIQYTYKEKPSVQSVTSSATVTPNADTDDEVVITAQAVGLTIANPSGTPVQGQALMIRIKDNASAQTIAFGASYRAIGVTLPTTTVASKTLYLGCIYNATDSKWDVLGINQEA